MVGHCRIGIEKGQEVDVVAYTTDAMLVRSSPRTDGTLFHEVSSVIEVLARQATTPILTTRSVIAQRAKTLVEYVSTLDTDDEFQRMVIVILCDTANEIILREQMKALGIQGSPLDEGIPQKIKRTEDKGQMVYRSEEVRSVRDLRNEIVHRGEIPDRGQAAKCLEVALDLIANT